MAKSLLKERETVIDKIFELNWFLISLVCIISFIGFAMLYSAAGGSFRPWCFRQIIYFLVFFPVMIAIAVTDIKVWFKLSYLIYAGALALLVIVAIAGHTSMGAARWIRLGPINLQPSEIMKVCLVFALARYFHSIETDEIKKIRYLIPALLMIAVPSALILKQPDLGTALILLTTGVTILFITGVAMWIFVTAGIGLLVSIPFIWKFFLHDYQKQRVLTFLNPESDPLGAGYNIIQSKIAIGSGGMMGKGFMNGTQGQLDFLPERQTDFIFTMFAEEFGFLGGVSLILLYTIIIAIGVFIAMRCKHQFGKLLAIGVSTILFFHVFINIAMVMGLIPVVGAPLPLVSYGGTITVVTLIACGLLLNVRLYGDSELKTKN